jgi:hypothetical protein
VPDDVFEWHGSDWAASYHYTERKRGRYIPSVV